MFGMMSGERIGVSGDLAYDAASIAAAGVRGAHTDINAFATRGERNIAVMVWNYHDDDLIDAGTPVTLTIAGIPAASAVLRHYRIDQEHSNSYSAWQRMGSPANPSPAQVRELQQASELAMLAPPSTVKISGNSTTIRMQLPRQAVSLVVLSY
jgi:xylan 1,4-beta-xylosidase